ncbi:MAG TPA: DUF3482 domain-containing protein [Phycisphaerales bacterium]|nr:DUF3482 domain-containing protein [Phycisphaerales bacterium]
MSERPISLAVIGHTNTGKTSVLRTLLRDATIGDVADAPGTTRESRRYTLRLGGREGAVFWDTPGLENAALALDHLRRVETERSLAGASALEAVLAAPPAAIEHDLLPLRTLAGCDAGLLVFDAREPPRNKYWEEHELLRRCGRPIVAVLNCTADERARVDEWDAALRRNGLHAVVRFDAWAAREADAGRLFVKLRELLDQRWAQEIERVIRQREAEQRRRVGAMAGELAALLVDLATYRVLVPKEERARGEASLAAGLTEGWLRLRDALADLHGVAPDRLATIEAAIDELAGREADVLDAADATLTVGSVITAVAGGLLAGGVKGGILDIGTGGATLGLGMIVGGAAGLALGGREVARQAALRARGEVELALSDPGLEAVARRGLWLIERLQSYGQASEKPLMPPELGAVKEAGTIPGQLRRVRRHRDWSRLDEAARRRGLRPEASVRAIDKLAGIIAERVMSRSGES